MRAGVDYPANIFEVSLPLGPVSRYIVHVIVTLGLCELVLEPLFLRSCGLDMVSAKLNPAKFSVCPVVTEISRLQER